MIRELPSNDYLKMYTDALTLLDSDKENRPGSFRFTSTEVKAGDIRAVVTISSSPLDDNLSLRIQSWSEKRGFFKFNPQEGKFVRMTFDDTEEPEAEGVDQETLQNIEAVMKACLTHKPLDPSLADFLVPKYNPPLEISSSQGTRHRP